jgi:predicted O-methyltransferase YrrM
MNIERAISTCGWMSEDELSYLARCASKSGSIVEIGSWKGRSTLALACNTPGIVYAVDTWKGTEQQGDELSLHEEGWLLEEFKRNTTNIDNIVICEGPSAEIAKQMRGHTFDMIFIDGYHTYEGVKDDILSWTPMLKTGGILCGHDYIPPYWDGLLRAVHELVPNFRVVKGTTIWTTEEV